MRLSKIELERFLGIRELKLVINSNSQIIAGPNNSGKTTILKALELFFSIDGKPAPDLYQPRNDYYQDESPRALTRIKLFFSHLSSDESRQFEAAIQPQKKSFWVELKISRRGQVSFLASRKADGPAMHRMVCDVIDVVHVPLARIGQVGDVRMETHRLIATVKDILVRSRPGPKTKLQNQFTRASNKIIKMINNTLNESKTLGASLLPTDADLSFTMPKIDVLVDSVLDNVKIRTRQGVDISIADEGAGFQSLLSLGLLEYVATRVARRKNLLFLIEEPEAFLHPQFQRMIASFLLRMAQKTQLVVTTHSGTVVDAVNIKNIARLHRDSNGLIYDWTPEGISEEVAGRLSRFCDAKNSELVFADKIIFCEGLSDSGVVRELTRYIRIGSDLQRQNISIIPMDSSDTAEYFVELANRFKIPFIMILDKDVYTGKEKKLNKICKSMKLPLSQDELNVINAAAHNNCSNFKAGVAVRDNVNAIIRSRNIFCLSADIEGAIAFSYSKSRLLEILGPKGIRHLSADSYTELMGLGGKKYNTRLVELLGSKGWNCKKANKDHKPKQHVLAEIVGRGGKYFIKNSDLKILSKVLESFLSSDTEIL